MKRPNKKRDGHIHSPYCPHGTADSFEKYIEAAISKGIEEITFTEHMPLPGVFMDEQLLNRCSPNHETIQEYFKELEEVQKEYAHKIKINRGLEVDYVEGYEDKIKENLESFSRLLEDGLLSVHFVKVGNSYYGIDNSVESFGKLIEVVGSLEGVYDLYYKTLLKAIKSDLGRFKPKRIGHPTLVRIFNKAYPLEYKNKKLMEEIVQAIKEADYEVDCNTAGLRKPYCGEIYPSGLFAELINQHDIKMVYGSDSHQAIDVGNSFE